MLSRRFDAYAVRLTPRRTSILLRFRAAAYARRYVAACRAARFLMRDFR